MSNKVYLTDEQCIAAARDVVAQLLARPDIESIKGVAVVLNGGLIPAYWVRKLMSFEGYDLPFQLIDVRSYKKYKQQGELKAVSLPDLGDGQDWIIVDEVCDTGNTFSFLHTRYPRAVFAALTVKEQGRGIVDVYGLAFRQDEWLVFPWELEDDKDAIAA